MDFDQKIEKYYHALEEYTRGRPELMVDLFSRRDDVSLANPIGPTVRGWKKVTETAARNASYLRDGEQNHFETVVKVVTPDLAYIVGYERFKARVGGRQNLSAIALRVTTIFRPEEGVWKIVHRHADTVVSNQPAESAIQE
ncbi:MAG: YybH family protein [Halobacteriota archaeon]